MSSIEEIKAYVEAHWDEIEQDIATMVAIPSVRDDKTASKTAPFGKYPRKAVDEIGKIAKRLGMDVKPTDGYCCVADLDGESGQQIAVVAHVDVVPAGPGWLTDPFVMEKREGWLLGRGVEDDKGPGIISLWAGHYFKEKNIKPKHTVRFLFGSDEETAMGAIKKYVAENKQPEFMYTPDAEFPVIAAEKGIFQGVASIPFSADSNVVDIKGGVAYNAIAGAAEAVVKADISTLKETASVKLEDDGDGYVKIMASGLSGHASMPEGTLNAIGILVSYLKDNKLVKDCDKPWVNFVSKLMADSYGEHLGLACEQEFIGKLTCIGGVIKLNRDGRLTQSIDIRFPTCISSEKIKKILDEHMLEAHGTFILEDVEEAHLTDPKDNCVQALIKSYTDVTGIEAEPIAIGGGTYAKRFEHSVAFGPCDFNEVKPEWGGNMHGPNESVRVDTLKEALVIYIHAFEKLFEIEDLTK